MNKTLKIFLLLSFFIFVVLLFFIKDYYSDLVVKNFKNQNSVDLQNPPSGKGQIVLEKDEDIYEFDGKIYFLQNAPADSDKEDVLALYAKNNTSGEVEKIVDLKNVSSSRAFIFHTSYKNIIEVSSGDNISYYLNLETGKMISIVDTEGKIEINDEIVIDTLIDKNNCQQADYLSLDKPVLQDLVVNGQRTYLFSKALVTRCSRGKPGVNLYFVGLTSDFSKIYFDLSSLESGEMRFFYIFNEGIIRVNENFHDIPHDYVFSRINESPE